MAIVEILFSKSTTAFQATISGETGGGGGPTVTTSTTTTVSTTSVTTTTQTQASTTTQVTSTAPPAVTSPPEELLHPPRMPQANPTIDKISLLLNLAGSSEHSPILSGLAGAAIIGLEDGEVVETVRIIGDAGFETFMPFTTLEDGTASTSIVFGRDTESSILGARNHFEVTTNYGIWRRQFWVKKLALERSLYIANQEAQASRARFAIRPGEPLTFGFSILPDFTDEFFREHEFEGNRFANTLRSWGGADTGEVFLDGSLIIPERSMALLHGYYWQSPGFGEHSIVVRLRASRGSGYKVDIAGGILIVEDADAGGDT